MKHEVLKPATTSAVMQATEVKQKIKQFIKSRYTKTQLNYFSKREVRREAKQVMVAEPVFMERFGATYNVHMLHAMVSEVLLEHYTVMMRTPKGRRELNAAVAPAGMPLSNRDAAMSDTMQSASPRVKLSAPPVVFLSPHEG